ncbi:MAG: PTS transporter subunit EIIA [Gammaproteobacteria bacterium]|nr:PTS transporter subunit EIIA [Gammaproteobacteria bacterium]
MSISSLLATNRIFTNTEISSKKRLLEFISQQAAEDLLLVQKKINHKLQNNIYHKLLERERLGSTGLGKGIALPHARLGDISNAHAYFFNLQQPINYDAIDKQKVDLIFVLFIPEESTEEHLQILASLAKIFSQESITDKIRNSQSADDIIRIIMQAETEI